MAVRIDSFIINEAGVVDVTWAGILNGDSGTPITMTSPFWKLIVQAAGTFGASGAITLQGSNDGVNYSALKDVNNTTVAMVDTTIWRVEGIPRYIRPLSTVGDGTQNLTVSLHGVV